jgi:decaprenyl-phosphate phosphoribosyltransferase
VRWQAPRSVLATAPVTATDRSVASVDDGSAPVLRRRGRARAAFAIARPKQWIKNGLVVAAAGAAGALGHDDVPVRVGLAFLAFCLISAGIYAINDSRDAVEDRRHPRKRYRPVAAGELEPRDAVMLGVGWLLAGLVLCFSIRPLLGLVGVSYVALTLSYTFVWRHVVVLDIFAVAGGFVLRALAGGVAAPVALSRWFVLVVSAAGVLVAAGKRHGELRRIAGSEPAGGEGARPVMRRYSSAGLWLLLAGSGACALFAYSVWAFQVLDVDGVPWRLLTLIPFAACVLRYGALVRAGAGEAPEELVLSDRWLAGGGIAWLLLFALSVHAAG